MSRPIYITTPIYYVNDVPHIGHAYTTVAADVLARYVRLCGQDVFFLTGVDEHGQKVQQAAAKAGVPPQQYCDQLAPKFQALWTRLGISNDAFIRTTDAAHKRVVQRLLQELYDKELIYRAEYSGWYCTFDERFWTEKDVVEGLCPDCRRPVEQLSESNYFFRMGRYQTQLLAHLQRHPEFIRPQSRANEVLGFLQKPLEDLSISRPKARLSWGIELPFDPNYVTYVWFDALANYLSALTYLAAGDAGERYWPATLHLVGKDILTTHAVYWSTILMALERPLPQTIFAHGWWTVDGEKMSKSRGNVVDPHAMVDEFGADAFRYFLLREVPFGHDGDFSRQALVGRLNAELANDLGNLLSRTITLLERFAGGKMPAASLASETADDRLLRDRAVGLPAQLAVHLRPDTLEFLKALEAISDLVQHSNQYIDKNAPWVLAKDPDQRRRLDSVLYHAAEALRVLAILLAPFMPRAAEEISRQLGASLDFSTPLLRQGLVWGGLRPGGAVTKGRPLFPRIETDQAKGASVTDETSKTAPPVSPPAPQGGLPAPSEQIGIEDFQKIRLQVAKILQAERVPKSDKLIKLQVDLGAEQRQIVAGIGKRYEPEGLIGRRIVVVTNLKPAKLMGIESQGMVLAAGDKDVGGLVTIAEEVEPGTKVK